MQTIEFLHNSQIRFRVEYGMTEYMSFSYHELDSGFLSLPTSSLGACIASL